MKSLYVVALLSLSVVSSGCSLMGGDAELANLTGEWSGSIVKPGGTSIGLVLKVTHVGDEISGSYRQYEPTPSGRIHSTGGSLSGEAVAADRIEILLDESRLLQVSLSKENLSGTYVQTNSPSSKGTVNVSKR